MEARLARVWRALPADVARYDLLDRFRLDVELAESRQGPARHIVGLEKVNLAGGERLAGQELEQPRLDLGHCERYRHERPPFADDAQHDPNQLAQGVHLSACNLIRLARSLRVGQHTG